MQISTRVGVVQAMMRPLAVLSASVGRYTNTGCGPMFPTLERVLIRRKQPRARAAPTEYRAIPGVFRA
jgi:hypothetical protein